MIVILYVKKEFFLHVKMFKFLRLCNSKFAKVPTVTQQFLLFQKFNNVIEKRGIFCLFRFSDFAANLLALFENFECIFSKTEHYEHFQKTNTSCFKKISQVQLITNKFRNVSLLESTCHEQTRHLSLIS